MEYFNLPDIRMPIAPLDLVPLDPRQEDYASAFYKRLTKWISEFDASLDDSHEVGIHLVNFGQTVVFHLEDMSYWNPSLISFTGHTEEGRPVELIQHVNQINVLLLSLPRKNPEKPKQPLGFCLASDVDSSED